MAVSTLVSALLAKFLETTDWAMELWIRNRKMVTVMESSLLTIYLRSTLTGTQSLRKAQTGTWRDAFPNKKMRKMLSAKRVLSHRMCPHVNWLFAQRSTTRCGRRQPKI